MADDRNPTAIDASCAPTRVRYLVLAAGCSFALLAYVHRQSFVAANPQIRDALHFDKEQMGDLASAFLLAYGLFQVPCGAISDRLGARHLLTMMVLGWSLLTAVTALAGTVSTAWAFSFVFAARFLFGAFQAGAFPVWSRVMTDWLPASWRASGQGALWMFSRGGGALAPLLFLWLSRAFQTWTVPLALLGSLGILWCAIFWPWFRNRPDQLPQVNAAERELIAAGRAPAAVRASVPWLALLRSVNVWALCLMYGFVGFAGNFITNLLPVYLADDRKLSKATTALITGLPLAFGIVSCILGGFLSDWISRRWQSRKWGRRINGSIGLMLSGLAILTVPWVESVWLVGLLFVVSFFCNDLNIAPAWAACADAGERYAGTISGAMNMTGQFGGVIGMSLAGRLLQRGHSETLFILFACSYALAACCWLAIDVTRPLRIRGSSE